VFKQHQVAIPVNCIFGTDRDMYAVQEQNKYSENLASGRAAFVERAFTTKSSLTNTLMKDIVTKLQRLV